MDNNKALAHHEMIELRELIDSNLVGAKKIQTSMDMVNDEELKTFMDKCLKTKKDNINSIESFVQNNLNV